MISLLLSIVIPKKIIEYNQSVKDWQVQKGGTLQFSSFSKRLVDGVSPLALCVLPGGGYKLNRTTQDWHREQVLEAESLVRKIARGLIYQALWWRRGESNSRPKVVPLRLLHA
jgi:hypothetical protein